MLPIYKVTSFVRVLEKGGRTRPWVVMADVAGETCPYVMKLFETERENKRGAVVNEVLGYVLARAFDLQMPQSALLDCDAQWIWTLPHNLAELFEQRDERLKFGTQLIEGAYLFNPSVQRRFISRKIPEIDTIFAFDNLIRNRDRNAFKPNLLIGKEGVLLIDNEVAFERLQQATQDLQNDKWDNEFMRGHIFLSHLKRSKKETKQAYFETFQEYLNFLNPNVIDTYCQQLAENDFIIDTNEVKNYLSLVKNKASIFITHLKTAIQ